METGKLYVVFNKWICDPETKEMPYKIGITRYTVDDRYYGLGLKMPGKFETLFAYKLKDYAKAEQAIQSILINRCVNGEWFNLNEGHINLIKNICETMDGELITDEIENEIEAETEEAININNDFGLFDELINTWNIRYPEYKTSSVDEKHPWRRILLRNCPSSMHYEFQYFPKTNVIQVRIDNESNNRTLSDYMKEWENNMEINGYILTFKNRNRNKLGIEIKFNDNELIIDYMKKLIEKTEKLLKNII